MAFETPKTDWKDSDVPTKDDFNRIEKNILDNKVSKVPIGCTWGDLKGDE